ncbi:MAG: IclR family transcriptional regulator [Xanthobacteraceae bacterium]
MSQGQPVSSRSPHGGCAILSRYALVLDTIAQSPDGLALSEIGQRTSLPQATVYRLVHALVHVGFLTVGERRRHYVLGPRLLRLMSAGLPVRVINTLAQPILDRLAADFGETAFVSKLEGEAVETVAVAAPDGKLQAFVHPGRTMPFHAAASAKVILAFSEEQFLGDILQKPHHQFTARTKTDNAEIADELARIRQQGFATCDQELDPGVLSYACPIKIGNSAVVYSLGLVGLAERLGGTPADRVVSSLKTAAGILSNVLREQGATAASLLPRWNPALPRHRQDVELAVDR